MPKLGLSTRDKSLSSNAGIAPRGWLRPKSSFEDHPRWEELARKQGVILPAWKVAMNPRLMELWLKRLCISHAVYKAWSGFGSFREFKDANPEWPLAAFVGLLLERKERGTL